VTPAGMLGLVGVTTTPLSAKDPAHVVRDIAKDPKNNLAKFLIFFMRISIAIGHQNNLDTASNSKRVRIAPFGYQIEIYTLL
jgi:hypothetical protein